MIKMMMMRRRRRSNVYILYTSFIRSVIMLKRNWNEVFSKHLNIMITP